MRSEVEEKVEVYVDDVEMVLTKDSEFLAVNRVLGMYEKVSGAIVNRSHKSLVMGLGDWRDRKVWPLSWLKVVKEMKVFGVILHPDYETIVDRNWEQQLDSIPGPVEYWTLC